MAFQNIDGKPSKNQSIIEEKNISNRNNKKIGFHTEDAYIEMIKGYYICKLRGMRMTERVLSTDVASTN